MKKSNIRDVAKYAHCSASTVSRYINSSGYVDSETAKRIGEAIGQLNYKVDTVKEQNTANKIILLVVPDICNPFYSLFARTVQNIALQHGFIISVLDSYNGKSEKESIKIAKKMKVAGMLFATISLNDDIIEAIVQSGLNTVAINANANCNIDRVHVDGDKGTYLATKHLISLGHKHIAFAGGQSKSYIGKTRLSGYLRAMEEFGLSPGPQDIIELGFSQEDGYEIGRHFSTMKPRVTAICCANDLIAFGLLSALQERGIKIPDEISVTGMDDIPYAQKFSPSLTTVKNDSKKYAQYATDLLFDRVLNGYKGEERSIAISHELVIRSSTAKPKIQ